MTAQICDFFDYEGNDCCLIGYTGGTLPRAEDFNVRFAFGGSTATWSGYFMVYGTDTKSRFVVRRIAIAGIEVEPKEHPYSLTVTEEHGEHYVLDATIPFTGYLLFSKEINAYPHVYFDTLFIDQDVKYTLFEAAIEQGYVVSITDVADAVRNRALAQDRDELRPGLYAGNSDQERLSNVRRLWDISAAVLPRRYDVLYWSIWYTDFPAYITELKARM